jgi:REP element-mobilizing transposase RayT
MARSLRVQFPGAWYHVMNRGASRQRFVLSPEDVAGFLRLVGDLPRRFQAEVHAYCVLSNHYHLLLRTSGANLADAMRHLDGVYTQHFHRRHGTDGALFRGRYRAIVIQAERHLAHVSRYIHLNPVEAGLAGRPEDWPHSSFRGYLDPAAAAPWLHTTSILSLFGSIGGRQRYRRFVEEGLDRGTRDFYGRSRLRPVLGDESFREEVRRRVGDLPREVARELPELRRLEVRAPLATIARTVEEEFGVAPRGEAPRPVRGQGALARGALVHAARIVAGYRLREIAAWLGYRSYAGAAKAAVRFQEAAAADPRLAARLGAVVARLGASNVKT